MSLLYLNLYTMKKNVNESNVILLATARKLLQQTANSTKYPSLSQTLTEIEKRAQAVVLTEAELVIETFTIKRQTVEAKLDAIVDSVKGLAYIHDKELLKQEWLKRGSKKNSEFFALFFSELAKATELIRTELTKVKAGAYAEYQTFYRKWQELVTQEEQKTEIMEKVNDAIDIRAGLMGICRMLGMPGFDIEKSIAE